jgi:hypothetical protein
MTAVQLPAHPAPPPAPGTECLVCSLLVPKDRPYSYLIPPDYAQGGYLCELCTSEVRGLFVEIRERNASRAARSPQPAPKG